VGAGVRAGVELASGSEGVVSKAVGTIDTDKSSGMLSSLHYNSNPSGIQHTSTVECVSECDSDDDSDEDSDIFKKQSTTVSDVVSDVVSDAVSSGSNGMLLAGFESGGVACYDMRTRRYV
jgi:hypothetical protein